MSLKRDLGKSFRKGNLTAHEKVTGSKSYQKFFEDFEEISVPTKNGKRYKIQRVYKGTYYLLDGSSQSWVLHKVVYGVMFLLSMGLFISAAIESAPVNRIWYVTVMQAVDIGFFFWNIILLSSYIFAERKMTVSKYKRACSNIRFAFFSAFCALSATGVSNVIYALLNSKERGNVIEHIIQYLAGAVLFFIMYKVEKKAKYSKEEALNGK